MAMDNPSIPSDETKRECRLTLKLVRDGNHAAAADMMWSLWLRKNSIPADSALCHRVLATVYAKAAAAAAKVTDRSRLAGTAILSAWKAVGLCPNSIEFAHFHANLLYEAARVSKEYERVVEVCQRALMIENPVDPATERLLEEHEQKFSTAKDRVANVQSQLRLLIQKSALAASAPWVKDLGDGKENVRLRPLTTKPEDPMYVEISEVEKAQESIRSYWNTLSPAARTGIFRIQISELRNFFSRSTILKVKEVDDAISFGVKNKTWKRWLCCDMEFADGNLFMEHVSEKHQRNPLAGYSMERVEVEVAEMLLLKCPWKPLELNQVISNENSPLSDESKRAMLLKEIQAIFKLLIENKCLTRSQINWVRQYAMEELESLACSTDLLRSKLMEIPKCICVLGAPALTEIRKFLQKIYSLSRHSDKSNAAENSNTGDDFVEKIFFGQDSSSLIIEFPRKVSGLFSDDAANVNYKDGEVLDSDTLLSWLFEGPQYSEALESWIAKEENIHKRSDDIALLDEKCLCVLALLEKSDRKNRGNALQDVEKLCSKEGKNRGNSAGYDSSLRNRQKELNYCENNEGVIMRSRFELEAITNVLNVADGLEVYRFDTEMSQMTCGDLRSHLCGLESGEGVHDQRTKQLLHQVDSCIEVAIHRQKKHLSRETSEHDARIMQAIAYEHSQDYRSILIPSLRVYLREHLLDLALKHAGKTPSAAKTEERLHPSGRVEKRDNAKDIDGDGGKETPETSDLSVYSNGGDVINVNAPGTYPRGLINMPGQNNCFLNVIIQSLWHLRPFRDKFMEASGNTHTHVGDPCIICALREVFVNLGKRAPIDSQEKSVSPHPLRIALSKWPSVSSVPEEQAVSHASLPALRDKWPPKFPVGKWGDAAEVLAEILKCLHRSDASDDVGSEFSAGTGSGDCGTNCTCIANALFGIDVSRKIKCGECKCESTLQEYTSKTHDIHTYILREEKVSDPCSPCGQLLYQVEMEHREEACPICKASYTTIHHTISRCPPVYTIVLIWNMNESAKDLKDTIEAFSPKIDISKFCSSSGPKLLRLVSVVCFVGVNHYLCFINDPDRNGVWIKFDDTIVEEIGTWQDVCNTFKGYYKPSVLMFEAMN